MNKNFEISVMHYSKSEMLEYLNPSKELHKEKFNAKAFHESEVQSEIMKNWWNSTAFGRTISDIHYINPQEYNEPEEVTQNFISLFTWDKLINTKNRYWVDSHNQSKYEEQSVSWAQFSLLENWTLLRKGYKYIDNLYDALILKNTLGENIYHTLVYTACVQHRSHQIDELLPILSILPPEMILEKDNNGESPLELLYRMEREKDIYKTDLVVYKTILNRFELIKEKLDLEAALNIRENILTAGAQKI